MLSKAKSWHRNMKYIYYTHFMFLEQTGKSRQQTLKEGNPRTPTNNQNQLCLLEQRMTILSKSPSSFFCTERALMTANKLVSLRSQTYFLSEEKRRPEIRPELTGYKSVHEINFC